MQTTEIILGIVIIALLLSNAFTAFIGYKLVRELTSKLMAGTLDNYADKVKIIAPPKKEKPVAAPVASLKDNTEPESALVKPPDEYVDIEDLSPEKSMAILQEFAGQFEDEK